MLNQQDSKLTQLIPLAGFLLLWIAIFWRTLNSMFEMWLISDSYTHAFLILPISIFLIWQKRHYFFVLEKQSNYLFILIIALLVFGWVLGDMVNVNFVKQFMIVLMIPAAVAALYGWKVFKTYLFPLLYLLFMVPFGDFLIPKLQDITAYLSVLGLKITGIPVYWEALYISIPSGDFEVAVACSGIRYLIASLALGTLYAYLTYQKTYKRLIFMGFAIVVPIIANGIRAYGIMIIAHLSDMKYATGVDHLIYGWLFFGVIIFLMFFLGYKWADDVVDTQHEDSASVSVSAEDNRSNVSLANEHSENTAKQLNSEYKIVVLITLVLLMAPLSNYWFSTQTGDLNKTIELTQLMSSEKQINNVRSNWKPVFHGNDIEIHHSFQINDKVVDFYLAYYRYPSKNKELVNSTNTLFDLNKFKLLHNSTRKINIQGSDIVLDEYQLSRGQNNRIIWGWYYVFKQSLNKEINIKLLQAVGKLSAMSVDGSYIAISTQYDTIEDARAELLNFLSNHWMDIKKELN